jgi:hypothetical protein
VVEKNDRIGYASRAKGHYTALEGPGPLAGTILEFAASVDAARRL